MLSDKTVLKFPKYLIVFIILLISQLVSVNVQADFQRDYELESRNDSAGFNLKTDLEEYYVAKFLIGQAWEDKNKRKELFLKYGIKNEQHWYQVIATVRRFIKTSEAESIYGSIDSISQLEMDASSNYLKKQIKHKAEGELAPLLKPVEGVSLKQWAGTQALIAQGLSREKACRKMGVKVEKLDRVSKIWTDRMRNDKTFTITTEFSKYFSAATQGEFSNTGKAVAKAMEPDSKLKGEPSVSFEEWIKIQAAISVGHEKGVPADKILKYYGIKNIVDWTAIANWWGQYFNRNAMLNNQKLQHQLNDLTKKYEHKFKTEGIMQ